jgi:6-phosphogluconolactonase (cycloisomerase 2 family)
MMADLIQIRRDTAANWASVNPTLESGEMGIETDTNLYKIGDGVTVWSSRIYGGTQGETGPQGIQGDTGADSTVAGPAGETGADGPQGLKGDTGSTGADSTVEGPAGVAGVDGAQGPAGADGTNGTDGVDGVDGPQGLTGDTGPAGADGADSTVAGPQGEIGETGPQGEAGADGADGADSTVAGPTGPAGADGDGSGGGAAADTIGTVTVNDLDLSTGNIFEITANDQTISFSGSPAIHEFKVKVTGTNVTSGFDLANSAYNSVSASISSEMTWPAALQFKPDGTKMYVYGNDTQEIYQYTLDPAWDIESRVYDSLSFPVSFPGSTDIAFSPAGDKLFVLSYSEKTIRQYTLGTPWVITTASYDSVSYYVGDEESNPTGLHVSEDGENLYIIGEASDVVYQYTLTTGWDLSTTSATPSATLDTSGQTNWAGNVYVSPDGLKMYVVGGSADVIFQYSLTTGFDLSTASYDGIERDITSEEGTPNGITFKPDGFKMYVVGKLSDAVFEYSMTSESIGTVTYPSSVNFLDDTPPTITAIGEVSTVTLYTVDSGANYYPLYGNKGDTGAIGPSGGPQGPQGETGPAGSGASSVAELTDVDVTTVAPTNDQVLKYNSTTSKWEPADGGGGSGATLTNYNFTATAGQTSFSGSDDNSTTLAYTAASLIVTLNGVMLEDGTDYTATDGSAVVLSVAASLDDELNVVAFGSGSGGTPTTIDGGSY